VVFLCLKEYNYGYRDYKAEAGRFTTETLLGGTQRCQSPFLNRMARPEVMDLVAGEAV
jgi:hypothetical protein